MSKVCEKPRSCRDPTCRRWHPNAYTLNSVDFPKSEKCKYNGRCNMMGCKFIHTPIPYHDENREHKKKIETGDYTSLYPKTFYQGQTMKDRSYKNVRYVTVHDKKLDGKFMGRDGRVMVIARYEEKRGLIGSRRETSDNCIRDVKEIERKRYISRVRTEKAIFMYSSIMPVMRKMTTFLQTSELVGVTLLSKSFRDGMELRIQEEKTFFINIGLISLNGSRFQSFIKRNKTDAEEKQITSNIYLLNPNQQRMKDFSRSRIFIHTQRPLNHELIRRIYSFLDFNELSLGVRVCKNLHIALTPNIKTRFMELGALILRRGKPFFCEQKGCEKIKFVGHIGALICSVCNNTIKSDANIDSKLGIITCDNWNTATRHNRTNIPGFVLKDPSVDLNRPYVILNVIFCGNIAKALFPSFKYDRITPYVFSRYISKCHGHYIPPPRAATPQLSDDEDLDIGWRRQIEESGESEESEDDKTDESKFDREVDSDRDLIDESEESEDDRMDESKFDREVDSDEDPIEKSEENNDD